MRKVLIIIVNIIAIFTLFKNVCFATTNLTVEANKNRIEKDEEVEIKIGLEGEKVAVITLEIYFDTDKLELVKSPENSNYSNNRILYSWVDETGTGQEKLEIGGFVFKAISSENTTTSIIATGELYNSAGEIVEIKNQNFELQIGEENKIVVQSDLETITSENSNNTEKNNANLKILRLNHVGINPTFSKDIKEYYIILDNRINELEVTAIPENLNSKVSISGNTNLQNGVNTVNIKVQSQDKSEENNYKIYVTKTANEELANANLENLAIRDVMLSPEFDTNVTKYRLEVASNVETLDILAVPQKENAKVKMDKPDQLKVGDNKIDITVVAENGITKKKYEIIVHRRNEQEQVNFEEETKEQAEVLNNILEEKENEPNNSISNEEENREGKSHIYTIVGISVLILVIIFIIYCIKKNKLNKN